MNMGMPVDIGICIRGIPIWAVAIGYFAYDEWPDIWSGLGAAIIIGATAYIAGRERRAAVLEKFEGERT